jgi:hypothetical protein
MAAPGPAALRFPWIVRWEAPVTAGPGDEMAAAAGRSHLRASRADRERVIDSLKAAFVQGRLTKDEFTLRVGLVLAARTYGDLAALTADLPARLTDARPPREPASAQAPPVNKTLMWGAVAVTVAALGSIVAAFPANSFMLLVAGVLAVLIAAPIAGTLMLDSWRENRSDRQLPPRPARPGGGFEDDPDGDAGDDQILFETREDARASAGPGYGEIKRAGRAPVARLVPAAKIALGKEPAAARATGFA